MTDGVVWRIGKKVILRPVEESDLPQFQEWINDPENNKYLMRTQPTSEPEQRKFYESVTAGDSDSITVSVCTHEGILIGNTSLRIDWKKQSATTGTLIGDKNHKVKGMALTQKC